MINALGEKHGTITARINDAVNFEVTTLRIDKGSAVNYKKFQNWSWLLKRIIEIITKSAKF